MLAWPHHCTASSRQCGCPIEHQDKVLVCIDGDQAAPRTEPTQYQRIETFVRSKASTCLHPISSDRRLCTLDVLALSDRCISVQRGRSLLHVTNCTRPIGGSRSVSGAATCGFSSFCICAQSRHPRPKTDSHSATWVIVF